MGLARLPQLSLIGASLAYAPLALAQEPAAEEPQPAPDLAYPFVQEDLWIPDALLTVCFQPGTPDSYVAEVSAQFAAVNAQVMQTRYWLFGRWPGPQGSPVELTYSVVPDGLMIPNQAGEGANPSSMFARMDAQFSGQGGRATWLARLDAAFERWEELSGISYTRVTAAGEDWDDGASWGASGNDTTRGDIRICMKPLDGGSGVLAFNMGPTNGDMTMDRAESWGSASNQNRFFRNTVMHENGHGIGIAHVCSNNRAFLLEPFLQTNFDGPQLDDLRAVQRHYGDPYEPDNSSGNPTFIGTLPPGGLIDDVCDAPEPLTGSNTAGFVLCSIDRDGEDDWFSFDLTQAATITVTLDPRGSSYDDNQQNGNGSCSSGDTTPARDISDLFVELIDGDGATLLGAADDFPAGEGEVLQVSVPAAGTYFIHVSGAAVGVDQTQSYSFSLQADQGGCPDADGDGVCDVDDACPGFDDTLDIDLDGIPDGCDCPGDVDNSGGADITDIGILLANFGATGVTWAEGDLTGEGNVDITDLGLVLANFGLPCP